MIVITWNIQWCRGVDGVVNPRRIADAARNLANFDVLCLQEVAINFPNLPGSNGEDQFAQLSSALPEYQSFYISATDLTDGRGGRSQFGNAVFTRYEVQQVFRHLLPWPADPQTHSMQRGAVEALISTPKGPLCIYSTHLEYYSAAQRMAQVEGLRRLHGEACAHALEPRVSGKPGEPVHAADHTTSAMICGDFNFKPQDPEHPRMTAAMPHSAPPLLDAWLARHPGQPHPPTFRVFDDKEDAYCCDYAFVTPDIAARIQTVRVDAHIDVSDHQPVVVELAD